MVPMENCISYINSHCIGKQLLDSGAFVDVRIFCHKGSKALSNTKNTVEFFT